MAVLPLNTFKTITRPLLADAQEIYVCPTGVTGIILLAQVANVGNATASVTFTHMRQRTATELIKNFPVPIADAVNVLSGRLVLEEGDRIRVQANVGSSGNEVLKITLSLVESANA
jgi:hypothetical protein